VSNVHPPSFPDGMDVEVLKFSLLKKIYKNANLKSQREHVTTKIWMNPKKYRIGVFKNTRDFSQMRITLDYKEDLIVLKKLYKLMGNKIRPLKHIQTLLIKNPKIQRINSKYVREEGLRISLNSDTKIKYKII
jgi:spore coat polysaccharide biosynthesis protein SpsF (cytidylyltransferase family)